MAKLWNLLLISNFLFSGLLAKQPVYYWDLVFRGASGSLGASRGIYDLWKSGGTREVLRDRTIGQRRSGHYKSSEVNRWDTSTFSQIKLAAYNDGGEGPHFVFRSRNTDKMNWLSQSNLISSGYSDLKTESCNVFSVTGDLDAKRSFYMNKLYHGCPEDLGWFAVAEGSICPWERGIQPRIIYSTLSTVAKWHFAKADTTDADEMAVYFRKECTDISNCKVLECSNSSNSVCRACVDQPELFQLDNGNKLCSRTCSWEDRWCFPGTCSTSFVRSCSCANNFRKDMTPSKAKCQPRQVPEISTCNFQVQSKQNDIKQSPTSHGSSECRYQQDFHGNFQVTLLSVVTDFTYLVNISGYTKPKFVAEYRFGITDAMIEVFKKTPHDNEKILYNVSLKQDPNSHQPVTVLSNSTNVTVTSSEPLLQEGDRFCIRLRTSGGGYLLSKNLYTNFTKRVPYDKQKTSRELCYIYDHQQPDHCNRIRTCNKEPLILQSRISRSRSNVATFDGWSDPLPDPLKPYLASGIQTYEISVHEVKESNLSDLGVSSSNIFPPVKGNSSIHFEIPESLPNPAMYAVVLEVTDGAGNVQQARRFFLFDNCSKIVTSSQKGILVPTASNNTNYKWQTNHGQMCFSWIGHFYNNKYKYNNYLKPIKADDLINGIFEQSSEPLPVTGTPNVDGIIQFTYSLLQNNVSVLSNESCSDVTRQNECLDLEVKDGDNLTFIIQAIDIMQNFYWDQRNLFIDSSVPEVTDIWLVRNGIKRLFVHHSTDLSKMRLEFKALDPHSGLDTVEWKLGTTHGGSDIGRGTLSVDVLDSNITCTIASYSDCYCPAIGHCAYYNFSLSLDKLAKNNKEMGSHNRRYFFSLIVTNKAMLTDVEHIDILVDDSSPTTGVVYEGAIDALDVDYTSEGNILVHWDGFLDHESGMKLYKVGISNHCLQMSEFDQGNISTIETAESSLRVKLEDDGKTYFTVIAYNNAMEPSMPSCSDGIIYDKTAPIVSNVVLKDATIEERVACSDGKAWLIQRNVSKIFLDITNGDCFNRCWNTSEIPFIEIIPTDTKNSSDAELPRFLCERMPVYDNNIIYLPSDKIDLTWSTTDDFSQMLQIYIGIGSSTGSAQSPDLIQYIKSPHLNSFQKHHVGFNSGDLFYIFIKAVNKAGLTTTSVYGPVLIDETPPQCLKPFPVSIIKESVVLTWDNNTCQDSEQKQEIGSIYFRIGHAERHVTPFMQWDLKTSPTCFRSGTRCIRYPILHLQHYDDEGEDQFYFDLHVFNFAGHYTEVRSQLFNIPSHLSPPSTVVLDIDPAVMNKDDADVILNWNRFCAAWKLLKAFSNMSLEIGLGSRPKLDDVMTYSRIDVDSFEYCTNVTGLQEKTRYFVTLKCSRNEMTSYSSSNGFVVIEESSVISSLHVFDGKGCSNDSVLDILELKTLRSKNVNQSFESKAVLHVGHLYTAQVHYNLTLISQDIIILNKTLFLESQIVTFMTMSENPLFYLQGNIFLPNKSKIILLDCIHDTDFDLNSGKVSANWLVENTSQQFVTHYEISVLRQRKAICTKQFDPPLQLKTQDRKTFSFTYNEDLKDGFYAFNVKPCIGEICLDAVTSNGVWINTTPEKMGYINAALTTVHHSCHTISLEFDDYFCSHENSSHNSAFYRWAVFQNNVGGKQITKWHVFQRNNDISSNKVSKCVKLPVYIHAALYVCLEGFCLTGDSRQKCVPLVIQQNPNEYNKQTLYEVDITGITPSRRSSIYSANIGSELSWLHESELDFTSRHIKLGAVITGVEKRLVTWYVQTIATVLSEKECAELGQCVSSVQTSGGIAKFYGLDLKEQQLYYICAKVDPIEMQREGTSIEHIEGFEVCGDGFIVNDSPPVKGHVTITSKRGYVSTNGYLVIDWGGFQDVQDAAILGYPSGISSYSYCIGTYPYGEDVQSLTPVGLRQGVILRHLTLRAGITYYATIHASDHVGHVTKVTSDCVLFDDTSPTTGVVRVGRLNSNQNFVNANNIKVYWYGFSDSESGIQTFEVGVGSTKHHPDVIPFTEYFGDRAVLRREESFHDGYQYYIFLRVTNQAGLSTTTLTEPCIIDSSPPTLGTVKDGFDSKKDLDYQLNTTHVGCHWHGFADPHSGIYYYNVGLGTARGQTDIRAMTFNALKQDTVWNLDFILGIRYFCLVEACNSAGLCSSQTSNGIILDNSAPIPGKVHVGIAGVHSKYISHTNTLQAQWIGFQDPHSDISHFEVCIGTEAGTGCDIMPMANYLLSSSMTKTGLSMPDHVLLYVTVRAYNKAGLHVDKSSDSFVIDTTPPTVVTPPYFETNKNITSYNNKSHFDLSMFKIIWKLEDHESPIVRQSLSLKTHHDGHTPLDEIQLTSENELVVILHPIDWLHSGDTYLVHVTSCNQAGLCTTASSDELLIDSTPPHLGGFKPPMTWSTLSTESRQYTSINLTWYGFVDIESSIKGYFITVGSSYSGSDLSNGVIEVKATNDKEQHAEIPLVQLLTEGQKIILSIWAENYAGLTSSIGKITVETVASTPTKTEGLLLIEKHSCDVEYCNRDCTCAVVGKSCDDAKVNATCNEKHQTDLGLNVSVHVGLDYYSEQKIISSSACISGNWKVTSYNSARKVFRYEWSVGRHNFSVGAGIFKNQKIWNEVGKLSSFTHCVPKIRPLVNGAKYLVYLKVWVSTHTFSVFQSPPVLVDITPPAIRKGRFIRISDHTCRHNMKYSRNTSQITACWNNVFSDEESGIRNYILKVGTSPGGYDIALSNCEKTETKRTWSNVTLSAGTRYYVTAFAFNNAGLQSSATSYGLLIDNERPYSGAVFNTKYHRNVVTQSSLNLGVSFHGFEDHHSSIKTYFVSVEEVTGNKTKIAMDFRSVGLINSFTIKDINFNHERKYQILVKAVDAAGFESDVEVSPPILIDNTPPQGFSCKSYITILDVTVPAKKHGITWKFQEFNETGVFYKLTVKLQPSSSNTSLAMTSNSLERKLFLASNPDGSSESEVYFVSDIADSISLNAKPVLRISQAHITLSQCTSLLINGNKDEFVHVRQISPSALSVDVSVLDKESGIKKIYLGVGTSAGGLQIKPLSLMPLRTNLVLDINVAHGTPVYVTALIENNAESKKEFHSKPLRIDNTPPHIGKVDIDVRTNFSSDNDSISKMFVQWDSFDKESGIKQCACAIDASSSNLVPWTLSTEGFLLSDWFHLPQGNRIKSTVRCVNNVGLERKILSKEYIATCLAPDSSGADIRFDHQAITSSGLNVQRGTSKITFAWTDFTDPVGIASYFCRVVDNAKPLTNWVNVGLHNYATFGNMALQNDHLYMAEVKAINKKDIYSQAINKSILILNITPQLTGRPAILSVHGKSLTLDWKDVFITDERLEVQYKVSAGSMSGFTDVLHSLQTKQTHITTETEMVVSELFVVIQARYDTGTTQLYKQSIK